MTQWIIFFNPQFKLNKINYFNALDAIGNLTNLETLDLSYNELSDISDLDVFNPPNNITNLILKNNRFSHLPFEKIVPMPNLKLLDVENNQFAGFNKNLMTIINNGTELRYTGRISFGLITRI